mmetsp:Transcript_7372/g.14669  ORF Transcript_7372/g.14669 Transcript_7372/m.14669 type:complete len:179 (-) Transcript_7372:271-807(-)
MNAIGCFSQLRFACGGTAAMVVNLSIELWTHLILGNTLSIAPFAVYVSYLFDYQPMAFAPLALAKANTCVSIKMSTRAFGNKYLKASDGVSPSTSDVYIRGLNQVISLNGNMVAFPGGVLIRDKEDGGVVGSVGVSGAAGDEDEFCALVGVHRCSAAEGLVTEPSTHTCATASNHGLD